MSSMQHIMDVSCIKKEEEDEEVKWDSGKVKCIKLEHMEQAENLQLATEIDIGPIKLEENVYNNIKTETEELLVEEITTKKASASNSRLDAAKETKSNNRRDVVRIFHQRIVNLDNAKNMPNNYSRAVQMRHKDNSQLPSISNAEHMRDLRQRLMNLENPIKQPSNKPAKTSNQLKRELEQRLMQLDAVPVYRSKCNNKPKQIKVVSSRNPPKSGAQRMRELRQRRRDQQGHNQSTNTRPPTPPELSVKRMREFRQRLLDLDKSLKAARTATQSKQNKTIGNRKK